jgi:type IV secretory pathway VirB4 component
MKIAKFRVRNSFYENKKFFNTKKYCGNITNYFLLLLLTYDWNKKKINLKQILTIPFYYIITTIIFLKKNPKDRFSEKKM